MPTIIRRRRARNTCFVASKRMARRGRRSNNAHVPSTSSHRSCPMTATSRPKPSSACRRSGEIWADNSARPNKRPAPSTISDALRPKRKLDVSRQSRFAAERRRPFAHRSVTGNHASRGEGAELVDYAWPSTNTAVQHGDVAEKHEIAREKGLALLVEHGEIVIAVRHA